MIDHLPAPIDVDASLSNRYQVMIFNNDTNSFDEVIAVLISATGCSTQEAEVEAWEAHTFGKSAVHFACQSECRDVAAKISAIGVRTEVTQEWLC